MTPRFRSFLLLVLIPVGFVSALATWLVARETEALGARADLRVGRAAAALFRTQMGEVTEELLVEAQIMTDPDPGSAAVQAALRGDTVAALGRSGEGLFLTVLVADEVESPDSVMPGSRAARIRAARGAFVPRLHRTLEERAGYISAVYFRGELATASRPGFAPADLPANLHIQLAGERDGVTIRTDSMAGSLVSVAYTPGELPTVVLLVSPLGAAPPPLPVGLFVALQVAGILTALILGWLFLGRWLRQSEVDGPIATVRLMPAYGVTLLLIGGLALLLGTLYGEGNSSFREITSREMVRALSVIRSGPSLPAVGTVSDSWGYGASLVHNGEVVATTLDSEARAQALLGHPLPPPTFPITGVGRTEEDPYLYAAIRAQGGSALYLTTDYPRTERLGLVLLVMGAAGVLPVLVFLLRLSAFPQRSH